MTECLACGYAVKKSHDRCFQCGSYPLECARLRRANIDPNEVLDLLKSEDFWGIDKEVADAALIIFKDKSNKPN